MAAKRTKLVKGQRTLFGNSVEMTTSSSLDVTPPAKRRGVVDSWRSFNQAKWKTKYPWIEIRHDGVYCSYCRKGATRGASRSGSESFISKPFTGVRTDVLLRHESQSVIHSESLRLHRESLERQHQGMRVNAMINQQHVLTVDGDAFCDALKCLYWLAKQEIPHTTNYRSLRELCVALSNDSLIKLNESKSHFYTSEQSMHEMLEAISVTLESSHIDDVTRSLYYSIIKDESTDLSTSKQLAIVVQYLNLATAESECKFLKMLDMSKYITADAENIVSCIKIYFQKTQSISLEKLAGASCDGAFVMLGKHTGVMTRLKSDVPHLIVTHCAAHRIALAASDAAKAEPWFKVFETSLNAVYAYFSRSAV